MLFLAGLMGMVLVGATVFVGIDDGASVDEADLDPTGAGGMDVPIVGLDQIMAAGDSAPTPPQASRSASIKPIQSSRFDRAQRQLILRSGDMPRRQTGFDLFETTWARSDHWARVILPPDQLPATAQARVYLQAAADLDQTGPEGAAEKAFKTALKRWPEQPVAHFGLASTLLKNGEFAAAQRQFEALLKLKPKMASAWNNYAYALKGRNCPASALAAARCGAALAPHNPAIADSVHELTGGGPDIQRCHALTCPTTH